MKTLTKNTTQPRSNTMREITDGYRPIPVLVKLHNYVYYHGFKTLVIASLVLLAVATFLTQALPQVGAHIIHDLITGK